MTCHGFDLPITDAGPNGSLENVGHLVLVAVDMWIHEDPGSIGCSTMAKLPPVCSPRTLKWTPSPPKSIRAPPPGATYTSVLSIDATYCLPLADLTPSPIWTGPL